MTASIQLFHFASDDDFETLMIGIMPAARLTTWFGAKSDWHKSDDSLVFFVCHNFEDDDTESEAQDIFDTCDADESCTLLRNDAARDWLRANVGQT
jgi:hypothetical protein